MSPNNADGMANSVDPDLGLHCLPRHICSKTEDHYGTLFLITTNFRGTRVLMHVSKSEKKNK